MNKWFDKPKHIIGEIILPEKAVNVTDDKLEELLISIHGRVSPRSYGLLLKLSMMVPSVRLLVNIKNTLDLLAFNPIEDVLTKGLTEDERNTLIEIDRLGIAQSSRATAHTLMDIEERMLLIQTFGDIFKNRRTKKKHSIVPKLLDY